ncbi:MAG TPA: hypothetical protein VN285_01395 [Candidatus Deferrimicrobium sp.]|nr:hypothetical protein [Candidatus Deferrimicrobium sp.]
MKVTPVHKVYFLMASMLLSGASLPRAEEPDKTSWVLKAEQEATARALVYFPDTGVTVSRSAQFVAVRDSKIPFLTNYFAGTHCWEVLVTVEIVLVSTVPLDPSDDMKRTFTVLLDPETGRLISASCVLAENYPRKKEIMPPGGADSLLQQLRSIREAIYGFAEEDPAIDFIEALNFVVGSPYAAKEIHVWYVNFARFNSQAGEYETAHPVYLIWLRGTHPIDPKEPPITDMRSVICARTGTHILSTNMPLGR